MKHQKQVLQDLAQNTAQHLEQFGQTLQNALIATPEKIDQIKETVGPALDKLHETLKHVEKTTETGCENAQKWADTAQRKGQAVKAALRDEPVSGNGGDKLVWLLLGLGAGALLGLLLAPTSGRRSRAIVRDQLQKKRQHLAKTTSSKAADLSNKARGITHKIQQSVQHGGQESATDEILADRIRTHLGKSAETRLPHLNIDCNDGNVTLHGPTVTAVQETALLNAVKAVEGVVEVVSKLPVSCE